MHHKIGGAVFSNSIIYTVGEILDSLKKNLFFSSRKFIVQHLKERGGRQAGCPLKLLCVGKSLASAFSSALLFCRR